MTGPSGPVGDLRPRLAGVRARPPWGGRRADAAGDEVAPLVDVLAPALLVFHLVLILRPFDLTLQIPGVASSLLFPLLTIGMLVITPTERLARIPVPWALIGFGGWLATSYLWTEIPVATTFLLRTQVVPLLMVPVLTALIPPRTVVRLLLGVGAAIGVWSLVNSLAFSESRAVDLGPNFGLQAGFRGTFVHKNNLGILMVFTLCLVLPFVRSRWRVPFIALCMVLIVSSRSATAASGLFAVCFTWFWVAAIGQQSKRRERQFLFVLSLASAIGAVLLAFGFLPSLLDLYQKDMTFSGRTDIWAASIESVSRRPLLGYGYGGVWLDGANPVTADLYRRIGFGAAHSHNGVIEILLQVGLIGLGLLLLILGQTFRRLAWALRRPDTARYGQWALMTLIALLLMQISEPLFEGPNLSLVMVVWTVLTRLMNDERRVESQHERRYPTLL